MSTRLPCKVALAYGLTIHTSSTLPLNLARTNYAQKLNLFITLTPPFCLPLFPFQDLERGSLEKIAGFHNQALASSLTCFQNFFVALSGLTRLLENEIIKQSCTSLAYKTAAQKAERGRARAYLFFYFLKCAEWHETQKKFFHTQ